MISSHDKYHLINTKYLKMHSKNTQKKISFNESLDALDELNSCEVSKASSEIMLDRFCNGKEIDFPFSNNQDLLVVMISFAAI